MTWTCDKEDDCENGEDETHCSERQGGDSSGRSGGRELRGPSSEIPRPGSSPGCS